MDCSSFKVALQIFFSKFSFLYKVDYPDASVASLIQKLPSHSVI